MNMDLSRALGQLADIHQQLAKGEVYRGYRSVPVAASGLIGIVAAWAQAPALAAVDPTGFVLYWTGIAACAALVGVSEIIYNYVRDGRSERRRTRQVVGQFLPSLVAGAVISISFVRLSVALVPLLTGLWAICFGIGILASRPYLPRASGWVAMFYYVAGIGLSSRGTEPPHAWWVGGTFGVGQLMAASVLFWNLERRTAEIDAVETQLEESDDWEEEVR